MLPKYIVDITRQLRRNQTASEVQLWNELRNRKFRGLKFLRQHPIIYGGSERNTDFFVVDFFCVEKKLIIELDGRYHDHQKKFDADRNAILKELNLHTLRIKNEELLDIYNVLKKIDEFLTPPSLHSREGVHERSEGGGELTIGIIILAAGSSSRMGQSKQLLNIKGETLLEKSVNSAIEASRNVVVVLGANDGAHRKILEGQPAHLISNPDWEKGMGSSLKAGLHYLLSLPSPIEAVIIMVCDQPLLTPDHLKTLIKKFRETKSLIVASHYSNTAGVPALFKKELFPHLLQLADDQGAKKIIQQFNASVHAVDFPEGAVDLDTPDDYATFIQQP